MGVRHFCLYPISVKKTLTRMSVDFCSLRLKKAIVCDVGSLHRCNVYIKSPFPPLSLKPTNHLAPPSLPSRFHLRHGSSNDNNISKIRTRHAHSSGCRRGSRGRGATAPPRRLYRPNWDRGPSLQRRQPRQGPGPPGLPGHEDIRADRLPHARHRGPDTGRSANAPAISRNASPAMYSS